MGKFWKKNKAVIITTSIAAIALATFIGIGYGYSKSTLGADVIGVGKQVSNLQYTGGTGETYELNTVLVEAPITSSVDVATLQTKINEVLIYEESLDLDGDGLVNVDQYEQAAYDVLVEYAKAYNGEKSILTMDDYEALNINEQTLVILAASGKEENITYAANLLRHFRPITYIGDDDTETIGSMEWDVNGISYSQYAYGAINAIYTEDNTAYRFRMRDGSDGRTAALWENGDRVKAEDIAFGLSRQVPKIYASGSSYMIDDSIANVIHLGEAASLDNTVSMIDEGRWSSKDNTDYTEAEQAIYYGWIEDGSDPDGTFSRELVISQDDIYKDFDVAESNNKGVTFYDSLEPSEDDFSYIEFHLNAASTTFPTQLASVCYWPLNLDWFIEEIGWTDTLTGFGITEDTFLSSGAFNLTKFDNLYGIDAKKSETYWDKDLVTTEKYTYRMVPEAATQAAMFKTGGASFVRGEDANAKVLASDAKTKEWMTYSGKTVAPRTKYTFWNFTDDSGTDAITFYRDPNFRRAVGYMFNPNVYHKLSGLDSAPAVNMFTPMGFLADESGNDLVDYGQATTISNQASNDANIGGENERLEYYGSADRADAVMNPLTDEELSATEGTRVNEAYANYYFTIFVDDMNQIFGEGKWATKDMGWEDNDGVKTLKIIYLAKTDTDAYLKALQSSLNGFVFEPYKMNEDGTVNTNEKSGEKYALNFEANVTLPATYISDAKSGEGYDMGNISWGADYLDVWSTLGIFNKYEDGDKGNRGSNLAGDWSYWDGVDMDVTDEEYNGNAELARELFNDGMSQFFDGGTPNLKGYEINEDLTSATGLSTLDLTTEAQTLWTYVLEDNDLTEFTTGEDRELLTKGLVYGNHNDHWADKNNQIAAYLVMEILIYDGAPGYLGNTESGSISPSRMLLEGDPVIGYANRSFGFDVTRIPNGSVWKDVEKELLALTPN